MKVLLIIGAVILLLIIYSACVVAGEYDESIEKQANEHHRKEGQKDVGTGFLEQAENTSKDN